MKKILLVFPVLALLATGCNQVAPIAKNSGTENWQTYTSNQYGFEVKYPSGWNASESSEGNSDTLRNVTFSFDEDHPVQNQSTQMQPQQAASTLTFVGVDVYSKASFDSTDVSGFSKEDVSPIAIGGYTGTWFKSTVNKGDYVQASNLVRVETSNYGYVVSLVVPQQDYKNGKSAETENEFEQILSTFKFINPTATAGWNTYADSLYGFHVMLPPDYKFYGDEVRNSTGALVETPENQLFNSEVKSPSSVYLSLNVWKFGDVPSVSEIQKVCGSGGNGNGPTESLRCDGRDVSQEDISAFAKILKGANEGQSMTLPPFLADGASVGTVVSLGGSNGLLVAARNTQAPGSTVGIRWFDPSNNLFNMYEELEPSTAAEAVQTDQYKTFLTIVSTLILHQ